MYGDILALADPDDDCGYFTTAAFDEKAGAHLFTMPTWDWIYTNSDCAGDDGWLGGYPEFRIQMRTYAYDGDVDDDCEMSEWPGSEYSDADYFRLVTPNDYAINKHYDGSFDKSGTIEGRGAEAGWQVKCTDCGVTVEGNSHIVVRTSNHLPFQEVWANGHLEIVGTLDFLARVWASYEYAPEEWTLVDKVCISPLCVGAKVAGVGVTLGISVGVAASFSFNFNAELTLKYDRKLTVEGTAAGHALNTGGLTDYQFSKVVDGFEPVMTCVLLPARTPPRASTPRACGRSRSARARREEHMRCLELRCVRASPRRCQVS